jgi:hypothetical protein
MCRAYGAREESGGAAKSRFLGAARLTALNAALGMTGES